MNAPARTPRPRARVRRPRRPAASLPHLPRAQILAAATRVILRRGHRGLLWSHVAREIGARSLALQRRFEDIAELVYECHAASAAALESALLRAETAAGSGRRRLECFLAQSLAERREHGAFLPLGRVPGLPARDAKRLRERELMIRARLERLLLLGERDGTLLRAEREAAVELLLGTLQHAATVRGARRAALDAALLRMLVGALARPVPG